MHVERARFILDLRTKELQYNIKDSAHLDTASLRDLQIAL